jgi:alpha-ketoglutarate-dependent taurine dioxygenase
VHAAEFVYQHTWRKGDMLVWDNRGTLHKVMPYDLTQKRVMQRTEVRGTEFF